MASLSKIVTRIKHNIQDGTPWVAIWKEGRSWEAYSFWPEGGNYDNGYEFSYEDQDRMLEILRKDNKAIIINGEYLTYDDIDGLMPLTMGNLIEFEYYNRLKQLYYFYESWVIKD
jgi:hypothetical protein